MFSCPLKICDQLWIYRIIALPTVKINKYIKKIAECEQGFGEGSQVFSAHVHSSFSSAASCSGFVNPDWKSASQGSILWMSGFSPQLSSLHPVKLGGISVYGNKEMLLATKLCFHPGHCHCLYICMWFCSQYEVNNIARENWEEG